ncbi:hypothetical protein Tco_0008683 [Tanacetum coccineum]
MVPMRKRDEDKDGDADDEGDDHISDIQDTNDEDAETESDEDEIYKYKIYAEKIKEIKDDAKKAELPLTSFNLSVSSGFGNQFLKLLSDTSLVSTVKDTTNVEINSLLDIKIQSEVPHIQSPSVLRVPVSVIYEPSVLTQVQETPSVALITTLPPPFVSTIPPVPHQTIAPIPTQPITADAPTITTAIPKSDTLSVVQLRVPKLEKDVSELKKIDHSAKALATLKSQVPTVVEQYLGSKITLESSKIQKPTIDLEQESKKSASEILKIKRGQAEKQKKPKYTIKSTDKAALKEYD